MPFEYQLAALCFIVAIGLLLLVVIVSDYSED